VSENLYTIQMTRKLNRPAEEAFHIVEDIERFPDFMPNVNVIELLESEGGRKVARWDTTIDDAPLEWIEEGLYDVENLRVDFRALEGVFDRFDGYWQVAPDGQGSRVTFELVYEIGLPEIEDIVGPLLRERMIENAESMLDAIERRLGTPS
jgi:ribosome-associated toxin RatA of RatAB toxin-antitoxin module